MVARRRRTRSTALRRLDDRGDRGGPAGDAGRGARPQAAHRVRPGPGRDHRPPDLAAAVRVAGAARPRAQPRPARSALDSRTGSSSRCPRLHRRPHPVGPATSRPASARPATSRRRTAHRSRRRRPTDRRAAIPCTRDPVSRRCRCHHSSTTWSCAEVAAAGGDRGRCPVAGPRLDHRRAAAAPIPFLVDFAATGQDVIDAGTRLLDLDDPTPLGLAYLNIVLAVADPADAGCSIRTLHGLRPRWLVLGAAAAALELPAGLLRPRVRGADRHPGRVGALPAQDTGTEMSGELNDFTRTTRDFCSSCSS